MSRRTRPAILLTFASALALGLLGIPSPGLAQQHSGAYPIPPGTAPGGLNRNSPDWTRSSSVPGSGQAQSLPAKTTLYGGGASLTSRPPESPKDTDTTDASVRAARLLKLAGDSSGLDWPLALRILPPGPDTTRLRDQIDRLVNEVRRDSSEGWVNPGHLQRLERDLAELGRYWAARADFLPVSDDAIEEGGHFLRTVREALR